MKSQFDNPYSLMGKFSHLSYYIQILILLSIFIFGNFFPLLNTLSTFAQIEQAELQLAQKKVTLAQQQSLLNILQQKSDKAKLTPDLTNQIALINQSLQRHHSEQFIIQQPDWDFSTSPILQLAITGNFPLLEEFLNALLTTYPQLHLNKMNITRIEDDPLFSLESQIILKLKKE